MLQQHSLVGCKSKGCTAAFIHTYAHYKALQYSIVGSPVQCKSNKSFRCPSRGRIIVEMNVQGGCRKAAGIEK